MRRAPLRPGRPLHAVQPTGETGFAASPAGPAAPSFRRRAGPQYTGHQVFGRRRTQTDAATTSRPTSGRGPLSPSSTSPSRPARTSGPSTATAATPATQVLTGPGASTPSRAGYGAATARSG